MSTSIDTHRLPWTRLVLIVAALIASVAVGSAIMKSQSDKEEVSTTGQSSPDMANIIAQLEERLKQDPESVEGWRLLGLSYAGTGRYADAARAYERVTALDPEEAEHWSSLGEARALADQRGLSSQALAAFQRVIEIDPKDPRARFFLGMAKVDKGDPGGAIEDWIALLKDNPPDAPWAASVRQKIEEVAAAHAIDVADQLAALPAAAGPTQAQVEAAAKLTPEQQDAMVRQMVVSLAARLRANPKDPQGWLRLMRAQIVLGDTRAAARALRDAKAAYDDDTSQQKAFTNAARALGIGEK
ncbi:MAG: tetratricopeptide repeat protein [Sphingomonadaceae bacterium]